MKHFSLFIEKHWLRLYGAVLIGYLLTHLVQLTLLPVFADEAIYIRWSQLIIIDWWQYLFFPLNDGKTPLHMWMLVPFLTLIKDQLFAARLFSVLVGLASVLITQKTLRLIRVSRSMQLLGMILVSILPFWFFHHRMALIDGFLSMWVGLIVYGLLRLIEIDQSRKPWKTSVKWVMFVGLSFAGALITKLPAIFLSPIFVLAVLYAYDWWPKHAERARFIRFALVVGMAGFIGMCGLLALKIHPAFSQLFSRGSDFTFSIQEVLTVERHTPFSNAQKIFYWFAIYLSPLFLVLPVLGLFYKKTRSLALFLVLSFFAFVSPLILLGKVLAPRYFLPGAVFLTLGSLYTLDYLIYSSNTMKRVAAQIMSAILILWSLPFLFWSLVDVSNIPFAPVDRMQYLTEWSSGFGHRAVTNLILEKSKEGRIVVATEGYFGTLPDAILMDLFNQDVHNVEVFGIGVPIGDLPVEFVSKAAQAHEAWVVVNSHRMNSTDPGLTKIYSFPRPGEGSPSLDVYKYTPLIHE